MWKVIAEEDIHCSECIHPIREGEICLSQLPFELPEGFHRRGFSNYCLACSTCQSRGSANPCFDRAMTRLFANKEHATAGVFCGHCAAPIPQGKRTYAYDFYGWPEEDTDGASACGVPSSPNNTNPSAGFAYASAETITAPPADWNVISSRLQSRFLRYAKSQQEAAQLYKQLVPGHIRQAGEEAVSRFLKGLDISHPFSQKNWPNLAYSPENMILEPQRTNRARGSRDMTGNEIGSANRAKNMKGLRVGMGAAFVNAFRGSLTAAGIEGLISSGENYGHWHRGRKTGKEAVKDTARSAGKAAATGAVFAVGFTFLSLPVSSVPITVATAAFGVGSAANRIYKANRRDLPLERYRVFFCRDTNCRSQHARSLGGPAA